MRKYRNNHGVNNNSGMLKRLLAFVLTTFIIPIVILLIKLLAYAIITFIIPFILNVIKKKLSNQQRLLCSKCHRKLDIIDQEGNFYCKNCKLIKFNRP